MHPLGLRVYNNQISNWLVLDALLRLISIRVATWLWCLHTLWSLCLRSETTWWPSLKSSRFALGNIWSAKLSSYNDWVYIYYLQLFELTKLCLCCFHFRRDLVLMQVQARLVCLSQPMGRISSSKTTQNVSKKFHLDRATNSFWALTTWQQCPLWDSVLAVSQVPSNKHSMFYYCTIRVLVKCLMFSLCVSELEQACTFHTCQQKA